MDTESGHGEAVPQMSERQMGCNTKQMSKQPRTSQFIRLYGKTLKQMAQEQGLNPSTIWKRHYTGKMYPVNPEAPATVSMRFTKSYHNAWSRCNNPSESKYRWYGGKGVRFMLTRQQLWELWVRDGAEQMAIPSLDRKDNAGHYTVENCQYIEMDANRRKRG